LRVSNKAQIAIKDACILINLLEDFFRLELVVFTTPQVIAEIADEKQRQEVAKYVESGQLHIDGNGDFDLILKMYIQYAGLSVTDVSVLELAIRKKAMVLSSDGSLRKISERQGLEVRGAVWIIETLWLEAIITDSVARKKLEDYVSSNNRAPRKEIHILIQRIKERKK
jgi:rRNA maturation endonuclease Nob1